MEKVNIEPAQAAERGAPLVEARAILDVVFGIGTVGVDILLTHYVAPHTIVTWAGCMAFYIASLFVLLTITNILIALYWKLWGSKSAFRP